MALQGVQSYLPSRDKSIDEFIASLAPEARVKFQEALHYMRYYYKEYSQELDERMKQYTYGILGDHALTPVVLFWLTVAAGTVGGGAAGAAIGAKYMPPDLPKEAKTAGITACGAVGALGGGALGVYQGVQAVQTTNAYKKWEREQLFLQAMRNYIHQRYSGDPILRRFVLNGTLQENCATALLAGQTYHLDVTTDIFLAKRIRHLLKEDRRGVPLTGNNPYAGEHFDKILVKINEAIVQKCREINDDLYQKHQNKEISLEEWINRKKAFFDQCGEYSESDPDWNMIIATGRYLPPLPL